MSYELDSIKYIHIVGRYEVKSQSLVENSV